MLYFGEGYYADDEESYGIAYTQSNTGVLDNVYGVVGCRNVLSKVLGGTITATGSLLSLLAHVYTKSLAGSISSISGSLSTSISQLPIPAAFMGAGRVIRKYIGGGKS